MGRVPLEPAPTPSVRVNPTVEKLAAYSWRLLVIAAAGIAAVLLLVRLRVVLFPIVIGTFLAVALTPVARFLRNRGLPKLPATALAFILFFGGLVGIIALIVPTVADEIGDVGPTITQATNSIENWLIDDVGVEPAQLERWRDQATEAARRSASGSTGAVVDGAVLVGETFAGLLLSLFLAFFMVKDGERFQAFLLRQLPEDRRPLARRLGARGWRTLGGYLRGSAALGAVEGVIIGITMAIVGGTLIPAVMTITFLAAFVPFLGAIVSGVVAVLVTFVTAGTGPALIVGIVALAVQQLDNDLLAPIVFGKALELHPVAILLGVATGAALGGLPAAVLAVPVTALIANLSSEVRHPRMGGDPEADPAPAAADQAPAG